MFWCSYMLLCFNIDDSIYVAVRYSHLVCLLWRFSLNFSLLGGKIPAEGDDYLSSLDGYVLLGLLRA